jgi:hypothetical protein
MAINKSRNMQQSFYIQENHENIKSYSENIYEPTCSLIVNKSVIM